MSDTTISPNMSLIVPTVAVDPGPDWANNINASLAIIDQHNHSAGSGIQINQAGINLTPASTTLDSLSFNTSNAYALRSVRFTAQSAALSLATDLGCLYVSGVDLYYNDVSGNQIKMTSGGTVNATSSGISSGTASASFSGGVLVVNAATNTPANIQGATILLGNNVANSKYLSLQPPNAIAANYSLTLPSIPAAISFVTLDTSGNLSGSIATTGALTTSNLSASAGILGSQLANSTITQTQLGSGSVGTSQLIDANVTDVKLANLNYGVSTDSGAFSTSSGSLTNVGITASISTSGNRPVYIGLITDSSISTAGYIGVSTSPANEIRCFYQIRNSSTVIGTGQIQSSGSVTEIRLPPSSVGFIDFSPGTGGSYTLWVESGNAGVETVNVVHCKIVAYQL